MTKIGIAALWLAAGAACGVAPTALAGAEAPALKPEHFSGLVPILGATAPASTATPVWADSITRSGPAPAMRTYGGLPWEEVLLPHQSKVDYGYGPIAFCFDRNNPPSPEVQAEINALIRGFSGRYQTFDRWPGSTGTRISLSWSLVPENALVGTRQGGLTQNRLVSTLDNQFGGNRQEWITVFERAFARWAVFGGITYTRVQVSGSDFDDGATWGAGGSPGLRGDVRIGGNFVDGSGGILAFNQFPSSGGDMILDTGDFWAFGSPSYTFLFNVIMHEHGHGLGMAHVCPPIETKLMEPFASTSYVGVQHDDIRHVIRLYNDQNFPNNNAGLATPISTPVTVGSTFILGAQPTSGLEPPVPFGSTVGLSFPGQQDWYRFNAGTTPKLATFRLLAIGTTYDNQPQGGSCPSGNTIDSRNRANMNLQVVSTDAGNPVWAEAASQPAGTTETITSVLLPPGDFLLRVFGAGGTDLGSQLYRVEVQGLSSPTFTASDDTFNDKVRLNWSTIAGAQAHRLFRSTTNTFASATQIAQVTGPTVVFDDTTAVAGTQYFYWIQTQQFTGTSPFKLWSGPEAGRRQGTSCPGDWNGDGVIDFNDLLEYLNDYNAQLPRADINQDGIVDFNDFLEFLNLYNTPC